MLLARHGETDWNRERRWQGHADRPLNTRGRQQAGDLSEQLASFRLDAIYASDLRRAIATAAAVAEVRGLKVTERQQLREVDVGSWSGLTGSEVRERDPQGLALWERGETGWSDGETHADMRERVLAEVHRIGRLHVAETVLIVSHGGPIRAVLAEASADGTRTERGQAGLPANGEVSSVEIEAGRLARLQFP